MIADLPLPFCPDTSVTCGGCSPGGPRDLVGPCQTALRHDPQLWGMLGSPADAASCQVVAAARRPVAAGNLYGAHGGASQECAAPTFAAAAH
eukprot:359660-Chlamydomonas_euryale.AAC.3